jgi:hypothetical protein
MKRMFPNVKDTIAPSEKKGIIYQLSCNHGDATYTGQSGQCIKTRIYRHMLADRNGDEDHYPLTQHVNKQGHKIDWQRIKMLYQETNITKRELMESFFIERSTNSINRQQGTQFPFIYQWLIAECPAPPLLHELALPNKFVDAGTKGKDKEKNM